MRKSILINNTLINHIIKTTVKPGMYYLVNHDDIKAAAYLGLCKAMKTFDSSKGTKFETYAYLRIKGEILDLIKSELKQKKIKQFYKEEKEEFKTIPVEFFKNLKLNEFEKKILFLRFLGFSLREIGKKMGYSFQYIQLVENKVIKKIKEGFNGSL